MESNGKRSLFKIGFVDFIRDHNIKFNPRPFSKPKPIISTHIVNIRNDNLVNLHLEIVKKVDALITNNEKEKIPEFKEVSFFDDYETTVLNPIKQEIMQKHSLWLE